METQVEHHDTNAALRAENDGLRLEVAKLRGMLLEQQAKSWHCPQCDGERVNDAEVSDLYARLAAMTDAAVIQWKRGFIEGVTAFETEWYMAESAKGERPYGFDIAGITRWLIETTAVRASQENRLEAAE